MVIDLQRQLEAAVANGRKLRELRFHTTWVSSCYGIEQIKIPFELENARNLMLRDNSRIRVIGVGRALYTVRHQLVVPVPVAHDFARVNGCELLLQTSLYLRLSATSCMMLDDVLYLLCYCVCHRRCYCVCTIVSSHECVCVCLRSRNRGMGTSANMSGSPGQTMRNNTSCILHPSTAAPPSYWPAADCSTPSLWHSTAA